MNTIIHQEEATLVSYMDDGWSEADTVKGSHPIKSYDCSQQLLLLNL